jgi:hypothetical protein
MTAYRPAGMSIKKWGKLIDYNLFTSNDWDRTRFVKYGCDENSLVDNPMFVYPENGDFRVQDGSSALQLGFKKFPMDRYGVQKPSLKAIARTPEIPRIGSLVKTEVAHDEPFIWGGMVIRNIVGEEYSAFGASKEQGGIVVLKLLKGSELTDSGLKKGDLIQGVAGKAASSIEEFVKILKSVKTASDLELSVRRHQKNIIFDIKRPKDLPVITTLASPDGSLSLLPGAALLSGDLRIQAKGEKTNIGQWHNSADFITWQIVILQEGQYKLGLSYSKPEGDVNVGLTLGAEKIESKISATGSWEKFLTSELGQINIPSPGVYSITLSPAQVWAWKPINVREISMKPVQ